jgi:putative membrane protein
MHARHLMALAASGLLLSATPLTIHAQSTDTTKAAKADSVQADARFIREVAADNQLEVQLGQLAQQKAASPAVKQFAERMATEHTRLGKQWTDMATKYGLTINQNLGPSHKQKVSKLENASAGTFDRQYMTLMLQNHVADIKYFQKEGQAVKSEPVKKLVAYTLPILQDHLRSARNAAREVGVDSTLVKRSEKATSSEAAR